ncbi:MAG: preprotein translocase subunit YajC [Gemmatimonadales bacterium]
MTTTGLFALLFTPSGQGGGGAYMFLIQIAAIVGIFYFLIIRPQRQQRAKHDQLLQSLQRGDQVVTSGGIVGEVIHLKDDHVTLKTGESRVVVLRSSIATIAGRGESKEAKETKTS